MGNHYIILGVIFGIIGCAGVQKEHDAIEAAFIASADTIVTDTKGGEYKVLTIEGCEFYQRKYDTRTLAKVDCDCKPNRK